MDLTVGNRGLVRVWVAYNLLAAGVWVLRGGPSVPGIFMACLHLVLSWSIRADGVRARMHSLCWILWLAAWLEIGLLFQLTAPPVHDGAIRRIDGILFGGHPHVLLPQALPWGWLQEVMGAAYLSYYGIILGPPLVLALKGRSADLARHTMGLMTVYLACFTVYLLYPVLGPRVVAAATSEPVTQAAGSLGGVMHALFAAGDSSGTAFPSSHCAASLAAAVLVTRHFGLRSGVPALLWAGLIIVSTIYTSNHYAVDAAAGVVLTAVILAAMEPRRRQGEVGK